MGHHKLISASGYSEKWLQMEFEPMPIACTNQRHTLA